MDDDSSLIYTFKLKFSLNTCSPSNVHKTKLISCTVFSTGGEIRETKTRTSYIAALTEGSDDMFDTKTLKLADVS